MSHQTMVELGLKNSRANCLTRTMVVLGVRDLNDSVTKRMKTKRITKKMYEYKTYRDKTYNDKT
jgi:hypothetical protein